MAAQKLTDEQKEYVLDEITTGNASLSQICAALQISERTFYRIQRADPDFAKKAAEARVNSANQLADQLRTMYDGAETMAEAAIARGKSENIRWLASKLAPDTYGERIDVNVKATVDLTKVLEAANNRALPYIGIERNVTPALSSGSTQCVEPNPNVAVDLETVGDSDAI